VKRLLAIWFGLSVMGALRLPVARGDERPPRLVGVHRTGGQLAVSVGLQDLFWPTDEKRLRSGFASSVLVRAELYRDGEKQPAAREARRTYIVYDIWDERFRVRAVDASGGRELEVPAIRDAIERATVLVRFRLTELSRLVPGAIYRVRFRADLNPLSEELVADVRRWLVQPPGQGRGGAGDSFFGSFVSFFVNPRIDESERQLTFFSQPFVARPIEEAHP
jgi:hypothetical protein